MRKKTITYNPSNYQKTPMVESIYGGSNYGKNPIRQNKTVIRDNPRKTVTRTVNYGPIDYYGKQTKTRNRNVIRK